MKTAMIEDALDELLTQILEEREGRPAAKVRFIAARELALMEPVTEDEIAVDLIVKYPVEGACRQAIRMLGKRLIEAVGTIEAQAVGQRAAYRDPNREGRRMSIINSAWNGIGNWIS